METYDALFYIHESTLYRTSGNLGYKYVFHRERYFMLSEMKHIGEVIGMRNGIAAFRFKNHNKTPSTSPANWSNNFSSFFFRPFGNSYIGLAAKMFDIREWKSYEAEWNDTGIRSRDTSIAFFCRRTESGGTFRFSRSSLLTKSTARAGNRGLPTRRRRGGRVKLNFGIIILWFHFPAWDERGRPRAFV